MRIASFLIVLLFAVTTVSTALGQTILGKTANVWVKELDSPDAGQRRSAAFALGKTGASGASFMPALVRKLEVEADPKVRESLLVAIGDIGHAAPRSAEEGDIVPVIAKILRQDGSLLVRRSAALALGQIGRGARPAQKALEAALLDPAPEVRQSTAWALGHLDLNTLDALRRALHDSDALVKRDAAAAMELFEPETIHPAVSELAPLCQEKNTELRRAVLAVLIRVVGPDDSGLAKFITPALADSDIEVRRNAALTLANIGGKEAVQGLPVLLDALKRADTELRRQAAAAIRNLGAFAAPAVPPLIAALDDPDGELRGNVALALGGIGKDAEPAIGPLVTMLASADERTENRIEAAVALSRIGNSPAAVEAVPTLLGILTDPTQDNRIRERTVWALRVHKGDLRKLKGVYPALQRVVMEAPGSQNRMLRYDCAYMSGILQGPDVTPKTLDVLLEFLKDEKVQVYVSKQISVGGANIEALTGKASVREVGKGDGRVMAVQSLTEIGPTRVRARADIVQQLRTLADEPSVNADLRTASRELLALLK